MPTNNKNLYLQLRVLIESSSIFLIRFPPTSSASVADVSRGVTNSNDTIGCLNETLTNVRAVHIIKEPQKKKKNKGKQCAKLYI